MTAWLGLPFVLREMFRGGFSWRGFWKTYRELRSPMTEEERARWDGYGMS